MSFSVPQSEYDNGQERNRIKAQSHCEFRENPVPSFWETHLLCDVSFGGYRSLINADGILANFLPPKALNLENYSVFSVQCPLTLQEFGREEF